MIRVEELHKRFGRRVALDSVSFSCPPGSVTGFLGPNGAGKSTTLRIIVGMSRADGGLATRIVASRTTRCSPSSSTDSLNSPQRTDSPGECSRREPQRSMKPALCC